MRFCKKRQKNARIFERWVGEGGRGGHRVRASSTPSSSQRLLLPTHLALLPPLVATAYIRTTSKLTYLIKLLHLRGVHWCDLVSHCPCSESRWPFQEALCSLKGEDHEFMITYGGGAGGATS
jgi:hypothetical protein